MAMTKNMRNTVNTISKLFNLVNETRKKMDGVKYAETAKESIEAAKMLNSYSKRVDRLCAKLGFEREVVDEVYEMSDFFDEDAFVLHILSTSDYAFTAYTACIASKTDEDAEFATSDEPIEGYPDAPYIAPVE